MGRFAAFIPVAHDVPCRPTELQSKLSARSTGTSFAATRRPARRLTGDASAGKAVSETLCWRRPPGEAPRCLERAPRGARAVPAPFLKRLRFRGPRAASLGSLPAPYSPLPPRKTDDLAAPAGDVRGSPVVVGGEGLGDREGGGAPLGDARDGPLPHLAHQTLHEDEARSRQRHRARGCRRRGGHGDPTRV